MDKQNNTQESHSEPQRLSDWQTQHYIRDQITPNRWCTNVRRRLR